MVGDDLSVTGVVDLNWFAMHGDQRLDLAGAALFADEPEGLEPSR
jgi:hypothetical protein